MDKSDKTLLYQGLDIALSSSGIGAGLIVIAIAISGKTDKTSITALQLAYSVLFFVVCFKTVLMGSKADFSNSISLTSKVINFLVMFFPFLPILAVILWILILITLYYDRITEGKVSDYYTSFMNIASFILLIQIYMIFSESTNKTPQLSLKTYSLLRLLSVLAGLSVITASIVLKFYVTDC